MTMTEQNRKPQHWKRSSYESADVYPEETRYGDVERKLKSKGVNIDEPLMDLDTLKLVLEALQLKGVLRKTEQVPQQPHRAQNESPPRPRPSPRPRPPKNASSKSPTLPRKGEEQNSRSARKVKPMAKTGKKLEVSEPSSMSESAVSDAERTKEKRSVLERCDLLLQSIAEFHNMSKLEGQPSLVSVLDSSIYNDDSSSSPSPNMKRTIVFPDDVPADFENQPCSDDPDFIFISDVLRLKNSLLNESDIFRFLNERRRTNKTSTKIQAKLVFDIATELIEKHAHRFERKSNSFSNSPPLILIWSEFQKLRDEKPDKQEAIEIIRHLLQRDLSTDSWSAHHVKANETVVDVERLIFRDLIEDVIRDLGRKSSLASHPPLRKKLMF